MSSQHPAPTFESQDAVFFDFKDTDLEVDTAPHQVSDESLRRYVSQWFATDLKTESRGPDLDRLLGLAREREQFCRGANDLFGLARCLGNQALIQKARGHLEEAMALLKLLEPLSRRAEDVEGLTFALTHQAALLEGALQQPGAALPLAEQAQLLATEHRLTQLLNYLGPLLERIRSRLRPA
jgi:hypothetical protein